MGYYLLVVVQMSRYSDGVLSFSGSSNVRLFRWVLSFSGSSDVRLFRWGIVF